MALPPDTDRGLRRTGDRQLGRGVQMLGIGVALWVLGAVLLLASISTFVGLVCVALGTPPVLGAVALMLAGGVSRRASQQKPFA